MTATGDELPRLPFPRPGILDIAPLSRILQAAAPITPVRTAAGDVAWLVTGYAEVKALLADNLLGRSHPDPKRAARPWRSFWQRGHGGCRSCADAPAVDARILRSTHAGVAGTRH